MENEIVLRRHGNVVPDTQWSVEFLQGMIDRMHQGWHKYGDMADTTSKWSFANTLLTRWEQYQADGNTEWLMDMANFCMMEFMHPSHPHAHYRPTEGGESPGAIAASGAVVQTFKTTTFHNHEGD